MNIQRELRLIKGMSAHPATRAAHAALFGETTNSGNREYLLKRIAWRLAGDARG
jgi:hypothetical protein